MTIDELNILINPDSFEFIKRYLDENPEQFALKHSGKSDLPYRAIAEQIFCYKKALVKLPSLSKKNLLFEKTALEQCSGETTAKFKSGLINGNRIIDVTGGLGIDTIYLAKMFKEVTYCEENSLLIKMFLYNNRQLEIDNINIKEGNGINILESFPDNYFDWIYVDPSRRVSDKRTVGLQNCQPNILNHLELFFNKSNNVMIKASPAIEIEEVKRQLNMIKDIYVVSVNNECKEVLLILIKGYTGEINISSVLLNTDEEKTFIIKDRAGNKYKRNVTKNILNYFYEPDSSIIKARLSSKISEKFNLSFVNESIDYLVSDDYISSFPGRAFKVEDYTYFNKNSFKEFLLKNKISSANIARRDFPDSPEMLKKKFKIKDGGEDYLFFTKDYSGRSIVILCRKVQETR